MVMNQEKQLKKLREEYRVTRVLRDSSSDAVKRFRNQMAKYTFADLDSHGKNPYFQSLRRKERANVKEWNKRERRLQLLDRKIKDILYKGVGR